MSRKNTIYLIFVIVLLTLVATAGVSLLQGEKEETCSVVFKDFDGTILKTETILAGKEAIAPANPVREGYTFVGWNKDYSSIVKDSIIVAEYIHNTDAMFVVDTVTLSPNESVAEVKVSVVNNPGILGMLFSLSYDKEVLTLVKCQNGSALSALTFQEPSKFASGCNFVWYGSETGEVVDGEMLILTFEIADNAKAKEYPITISWNDRDIYDSNCDMLNPKVVEGGITIVE